MGSQDALRFMNDPKNWYLSRVDHLVPLRTTAVSIEDSIMYQVDTIQQQTGVDFQSMRNILDAMQLPGILFFYLMEGKEGAIAYYYGVSQDATYFLRENTRGIMLKQAAEIFEAVFAANYPLNTLKKVKNPEKQKIQHRIHHYPCGAVLEGVPGKFNDSTTTLGASNVKQAMQNDNFIAIEVLKPMTIQEINRFVTYILQVNSCLEELAHSTKNSIVTGSKTCSFNVNAGQLRSNSKIRTSNETRKEFRIVDTETGGALPPAAQIGLGSRTNSAANNQAPTSSRVAEVLNGLVNPGILGEDTSGRPDATVLGAQQVSRGNRRMGNPRVNQGRRNSRRQQRQLPFGNPLPTSNVPIPPLMPGTGLASDFEGADFALIDGDFLINNLERQVGRGTNNTRLYTASDNISNNRSNTCTSTTTQIQRTADKNAINWQNYIDNLLYPRLDNGKAIGLYMFSSGIFAGKQATLVKLASALKYTYNSSSYNNIPMLMTHLGPEDIRRKSFEEFQLPMYEVTAQRYEFSESEQAIRAVFSQCISSQFACGGSYLSSKELSSIIALPL